MIFIQLLAVTHSRTT